MLRRFARALLAFALIAGWQAALLHPIQHVDKFGALVHAGERSGSTTELLCDKLAALTACVPEAPALYAAAPPHLPLIEVLQDAPRIAQAPPFLSQGPPSLLLKS